LHRKCSTAAVVKRLHQCLHQCLVQPYPLFRTTATTPALEPRVSPCRSSLAISSQTLAVTAGSAAPLQLPATTPAGVPPARPCRRLPAISSQALAATARAAAHLLEVVQHICLRRMVITATPLCYAQDAVAARPAYSGLAHAALPLLYPPCLYLAERQGDSTRACSLWCRGCERAHGGVGRAAR